MLLAPVDRGQIRVQPNGLTVDGLLDLYLDGIDADGRLSAKTRSDHHRYARDYIRPHLGSRRVRDINPEVVPAWQRKLTKEGGTKDGKPLSANTVRLARAPLAGAFKMAHGAGVVAINPMVGTPRPRARRSIPRHGGPEQARELLTLMDGDRTWPVWAFLLGSGVRIGELLPLRWSATRAQGKWTPRIAHEAFALPDMGERRVRRLLPDHLSES